MIGNSLYIKINKGRLERCNSFQMTGIELSFQIQMFILIFKCSGFQMKSESKFSNNIKSRILNKIYIPKQVIILYILLFFLKTYVLKLERSILDD